MSNSVNRPDMESGTWAPVISAVFACYGVAQYLPDLLDSLDAQDAAIDTVEYIFVIDGSPDTSEQIVSSWMTHTTLPVRLIIQENGGVASARNHGVSLARGTWVTTPDPDDWIAHNYFTEVLAAQHSFPSEHMFVATVDMRSATGTALRHPLDFRNTGSDPRLVDLAQEPRSIHTLGGVTFVRRSCLAKHGLQFDQQIVQASDSHFIARYLNITGARYVLVPGARYEYRQRADNSGLVASRIKQLSRHVNTFAYAHPDLIAAARAEHGTVPQWLANFMLYFTFMLFRRDLRGDETTRNYDRDGLQTVVTAIRSNLDAIGSEAVRAYNVLPLDPRIRGSWLAATGALERSHWYPLHQNSKTHTARMASLAASEGAAAPHTAPGEQARLIASTVREIRILGDIWCYEQVCFFEHVSGELSLVLDGAPALVVASASEAFGQVRANSGDDLAVKPVGRRMPSLRSRLRPRARLAALKLRRERVRRHAWLVTYNADYRAPLTAAIRALREHTSARSALVVVASATQLPKLQHEFPGTPIVEHGSPAHRATALDASVSITVSTSKRAVAPFGADGGAALRVYLHVGAAIDGASLSDIDLVVVADIDDRHRFCGLTSEYAFTDAEVVVVGQADAQNAFFGSRIAETAVRWLPAS